MYWADCIPSLVEDARKEEVTISFALVSETQIIDSHNDKKVLTTIYPWPKLNGSHDREESVVFFVPILLQKLGQYSKKTANISLE